jgi:hypothetical protein
MATATRTRTASLLLILDGTYYRVDRLDPGFAGAKAYRLHKCGPDGEVYDVVQGEAISCTCGDYEHRRRGITPEPCKHGVALLAFGLFGEPRPEPEPEPEPVVLHPIRYCGSNGRWYDDEREARSAYSWQQDQGRERP